jgi:hypothetical protein
VGAEFARDLQGEAGLGFAASGPLDGLGPGVVLAGFALNQADVQHLALSRLSATSMIREPSVNSLQGC